MPRRLVRIAAMTSFALLLASVAAALGEQAVLLELLVHFRVPFAVLAGLLALICAALRRPLAAGAATLACALNAWPVATHLLAPRAEPLADASPLRLMSVNVERDSFDIGRLAARVRAFDPDVLVLIELTPRALQALAPLLDGRYPHRLTRAHGAYFGIGLFSRLPLAQAAVVDLDYREAPALDVQVAVAERQLRIIALHLEWPVTPAGAAARNRQLRQLVARVGRNDSPLVVIGDFNTTRWTRRFAALLDTTGLRDAATGRGIAPTWPGALAALGIGIAIDHCLVSPGVQVSDFRVGPALGSDHLPLLVTLGL